MVHIIQDFIPVGRNNRPGRANSMKYITVHNTGNTGVGAGAKNHAAYIKGDAAASIPASWHYTCDEHVIYQHIPDTEIAWHAGDGGTGPGNNTSIGIEICMNSDGDLLKATDNGVWLTADLMKRHSIPITNIVQHHHWSGKNCPQMLRQGKPYSWAEFISKVQAAVSEPTQEDTVPVVVGDGLTLEGIRIHGSVYAAVRPVCEALGHTVHWDGKQVLIE